MPRTTGVFKVNAAELDTALAGILELRDSPGTSKIDPSAHGSGFDRVGAFQDGYDNGPEACKAYRDDDPVVVELPFNDAEDAASGGDAPYDSIINGVPYDLEDYWTQVYPELTDGQPWVPVKGLEPFDPANPPPCGGNSTEGLRRCSTASPTTTSAGTTSTRCRRCTGRAVTSRWRHCWPPSTVWRR